MGSRFAPPAAAGKAAAATIDGCDIAIETADPVKTLGTD